MRIRWDHFEGDRGVPHDRCVDVGDRFSIINPAGRATPFGTLPREISYEVAALFEVGVYDYDKAFVIMPMSDAQTLLLLGDVVVCPAVAVANAPAHAGSYDDEVALLVVHGVLHLLGMDHATDDERDAMQARERELLAAHHGPLAADPWAALAAERAASEKAPAAPVPAPAEPEQGEPG